MFCVLICESSGTCVENSVFGDCDGCLVVGCVRYHLPSRIFKQASPDDELNTSKHAVIFI